MAPLYDNNSECGEMVAFPLNELAHQEPNVVTNVVMTSEPGVIRTGHQPIIVSQRRVGPDGFQGRIQDLCGNFRWFINTHGDC
jgi:hypothetical protein